MGHRIFFQNYTKNIGYQSVETLIKSVLHRCIGCRWTGGSFHHPDMPPLPLGRVEEASPFLNVKIDYMGPIEIRSGDSVQKEQVAIFACLVTRAIHLEIA